jgi:hypothetical protein
MHNKYNTITAWIEVSQSRHFLWRDWTLPWTRNRKRSSIVSQLRRYWCCRGCVCVHARATSISDASLHGNSPITTSSFSVAQISVVSQTQAWKWSLKRLHKGNVYEQIADHFQRSRLWYRDKLAHQLFPTLLSGEYASRLQYLLRFHVIHRLNKLRLNSVQRKAAISQ